MTDLPDVTAAGRLRLEVVTASQPAADRWVANGRLPVAG